MTTTHRESTMYQESLFLESLGSRPLAWAEALAVLEGFTCAWAGIEGPKIGPAPEEPPAFSHLWGWRGKECVRLRLDEDDVYGGVLHVADSPREDRPFEPVVATVRHGRLWGRDEGQAGPLPAAAYDMEFELVEVPGQAAPHGGGPMTFVRAPAAPAE